MKLKQLNEFTTFARSFQAPLSGWPQVVLMAAGFYNICFGLWAIFFPQHYFYLNDLPEVNLSLWQCIGMIVGLYGLAYLFSSTDIERYWPIVLIGLMGKIFGPIGYVFHLFTGQTNAAGLLVILFNDLIWWIPFVLILLKVCNKCWREKEGITLNSDEKGNIFYRQLCKDSGDSKVLLIFLRHFGCTFCQEALINLAEHYKTISEKGIKLYVVHMGSHNKFQEYFDFADMKKVSHVEDSQQVLYSFFELKRGSLFNIFSPEVFVKGVSLMKEKGLGVGKLEGDGFQLAGCFLIENQNIIKSFRNESAINTLDYMDFVNLDLVKEKTTSPKVTLYFDGDCPLCEREVSILKSITAKNKVSYEDISEKNFNTNKHGKDCSILMAEIHAKDQDGNWLVGMDAFRAVYAHTPYKRLFALTKLPIVKNIFDFAYSVFAKNRLKLTGRGGHC